MTRPIVARIDCAALTHNLMRARALAGRTRLMAVIKANAYGHGLLRVAQALRGADGFAVLGLDEAAALRGAGFSHPILLLQGFFHTDELAEIARRRLQPVIHRDDQIDALARSRFDHRLDVFLKIDTGMHRLGFAPPRLPDALARLRDLPQIGQISLMSHFARADEAAASVAEQFATFQALTAGSGLPVSLANSAALLRYPETHADWARPGLMLYGASPFAGQTGAELGLLPAMRLDSALIAIQSVRKGEGVGYGHTFVAPRDMRVGIVACGYADGYPRHAGTGTPVRVGGHLSRTLGRVSMDMLHVDLTEVPDAHVGTPVTLWGDGLPVEQVAAAAGTIAYELFTALAPRVPVEEI
jgi:alanine racemase